jgi:hypothetical protein
MLSNLNSHTRHLSTFHSLPIILRLHLHINLHTCGLAHYARSVKIFAAGLPSTYDSRFRYSCSAYDADTLRFRCLRLFATALRFRRMMSACIYHLQRSSGFYNLASIDRRFSDYHNHRHCDFHPRLRLRPAIGTLGLQCQRATLMCVFGLQRRELTCDFGLRWDLQFAPQVYRLLSLPILRF